MKVLFISHNSFRAGAQLFLLDFLKWLKEKHTEIEFEILLRDKTGSLYDDFASLAPVMVWNYQYKKVNLLAGEFRHGLLKQKIRRKKFDLIYSNTIVNGSVTMKLANLGIPIITHVHEMWHWIDKTGADNLEKVKASTKNYITTSKAVKRCLVDDYQFQPDVINPVNGFISYNKVSNCDYQYSLRKKLNLPQDSILVGASGAEIWRKGKDWFVPLALQLLAKNDNIHFVWIGGGLTEELSYDLERSGKHTNIHFIPHLENASHYFHELSVFCMLSREEALGLVVLEAGAHAVPSVCFDNAGGTPEIYEEGGGVVVPYGNIYEMANAIQNLLENETERNRMGQIAKATVKNRYDVEVVGLQLVDAILAVKQ